MTTRKATIAALVMVLIAFTAITSFAGEILAFKTQLPQVTIRSGSCTWVACGSIRVNAPQDGHVVVTASGMAFFEGVRATSLTLTLAKASAIGGAWKYTLSPGVTPYQTYSVQMVFPVRAGLQTFHLNGRSCNGGGRIIGVQTGSLTAEFYPDINVQPRTAVQTAPKAETGKEPADININDDFENEVAQ